MADIYIVKYIFDILYNASVKHSLSVYPLKIYVWLDFYTKISPIF